VIVLPIARTATNRFRSIRRSDSGGIVHIASPLSSTDHLVPDERWGNVVKSSLPSAGPPARMGRLGFRGAPGMFHLRENAKAGQRGGPHRWPVCTGPVGCKHRIPTPRSTKIARTGSGCQEASTRSPVIHCEVKCVGNDIDVTRRGHGIASKQQAFR
jgi:hypothetical protein